MTNTQRFLPFAPDRSTTVYNAAGQTVASSDPLGFRGTSVYDAAGRSVAQINALGNRNTSGT